MLIEHARTDAHALSSALGTMDLAHILTENKITGPTKLEYHLNPTHHLHTAAIAHTIKERVDSIAFGTFHLRETRLLGLPVVQGIIKKELHKIAIEHGQKITERHTAAPSSNAEANIVRSVANRLSQKPHNASAGQRERAAIKTMSAYVAPEIVAQGVQQLAYALDAAERKANKVFFAQHAAQVHGTAMLGRLADKVATRIPGFDRSGIDKGRVLNMEHELALLRSALPKAYFHPGEEGMLMDFDLSTPDAPSRMNNQKIEHSLNNALTKLIDGTTDPEAIARMELLNIPYADNLKKALRLTVLPDVKATAHMMLARSGDETVARLQRVVTLTPVGDKKRCALYALALTDRPNAEWYLRALSKLGSDPVAKTLAANMLRFSRVPPKVVFRMNADGESSVAFADSSNPRENVHTFNSQLAALESARRGDGNVSGHLLAACATANNGLYWNVQFESLIRKIGNPKELMKGIRENARDSELAAKAMQAVLGRSNT